MGLVKESPQEVHRILKISRWRPDLTGAGQVDIAVGDVRNFRRDPTFPRFTRQDGSWFDFQLTIRVVTGGYSVVSYDFEIRFVHQPRLGFLRFDLNPPGHGNDEDGLRSHLHLNVDDDGFSIPTPMLSPFEVLDIFLHGVSPTGRVRRLESGSLTAAPPEP